jgi:hypothetical protein
MARFAVSTLGNNVLMMSQKRLKKRGVRDPADELLFAGRCETLTIWHPFSRAPAGGSSQG